MQKSSTPHYTDDTCVIIPECNLDTRTVELANIDPWAQANNRTLNRAKTKETVFTYGERKCPAHTPLSIRRIARATCLKILDVTITN